MEFVNVWREADQVLSKEDAIKAIKIIAPLAPYISEEIYQGLTNDKEFNSVHLSSWPEFDENQVKEDIVTIPIQINGKLRQTLEVSSEQSKIQNEIEKLARELPNVKKYLSDKPKKVVFVPGRLLNFVI